MQKKDENVFRELVESWKDRIYNTALGIVQNEQDAADITQEVFLNAWRTIGDFKGGSEIGTWLYRITVNRSLDHLRKLKRRKTFALIPAFWRSEDKSGNEDADFVHPGVQMEKKQEAAILFAAIRKLPEQQRITYTLKQVEGLTVTEIGAILQLTESAIESLLQRAKNNLKKLLADYYQKTRYE